MSSPAKIVLSQETPCELPPGYWVAPFPDGSSGGGSGSGAAATSSAHLILSPIRLGVVVGPSGLVPVHDLLDARAYLACVADAAGRVHQWTELWVQETDGIDATPLAYRQGLTNAALDARWSQRSAMLEALGPGGLLRTGWEASHPGPLFVDVHKKQVVQPRHESGAWGLCTDDAFLSTLGLPAYSTSTQRVLVVRTMGERSPIVPANRQAGSEGPASLAKVLGLPDALPLNPAGGLMMARPLSPLSVEEYLNALAGTLSDQSAYGDGALKGFAEAMSARDDSGGLGGFWSPAAGTLFLGRPQRTSRLTEVFYLKLRLLADMASSIRRVIAQTQTPFLNLSLDSFRVSLGLNAGGNSGNALPFLWTSRAVLRDCGEALRLPIKQTNEAYFMTPGAATPSIYSPAGLNKALSGRGLMRIRRVVTEGGLTTLEATLNTTERLGSGRNDLLWVHFSVGGERFDLYGIADESRGMAASEVRFHTIAHELGGRASALKAAEGIPIQDASFELIPMISSPCDLYSLGVMAIRVLLVNDGNTLPVALDECMSLAYEAGGGEDAATLEERIARLMEKDARWSDSLGPQRLLPSADGAGRVFEALPPELWSRALAMIVRMLPGIGPESRCRDLGDAPAGALQKVFDRAEKDLNDLLVRTLGLVVNDQPLNRELRSVLAGIR
ncbi:MAG: hypothetical protein SFZ23_06925 [Planctomycetota bacterium]|nr:hypothetical protein [Planctomycetota bacterium]